MLINGEQKSLEGEISVGDFLARESYDPLRVAVEKNGNIVPKSAYDSEMLCDGDKIEIVCFVGGG